MTTRQTEMFDTPAKVEPSSQATFAPPQSLARAPGGPGRLIMRPRRRSLDTLDRPALEALCHAFGLAVVGEHDEVLRNRLAVQLRCR